MRVSRLERRTPTCYVVSRVATVGMLLLRGEQQWQQDLENVQDVNRKHIETISRSITLEVLVATGSMSCSSYSGHRQLNLT